MKIMKVKISKQHHFLDIDLDQFRFSKIIDKEHTYFCLELLKYTGFVHPKVLVLGHHVCNVCKSCLILFFCHNIHLKRLFLCDTSNSRLDSILLLPPVILHLIDSESV